MTWLRKLLALGVVVVLTELSLFVVTHLPVDQNPIGLRGMTLPSPAPPWLLGYGYEPPSTDHLGWLTSHGVRLVQVPLQDGPAIAAGQVDATVRHMPDSITFYGIGISYDPQRERSREVALAVSQLIDRYPGRPSRAFPQAIADEPLSFHLFFGILVPLLLLLAAGLGLASARSRRSRGRFGASLALVAGLLVLLAFQLPYVEFQGNEATSSSVSALFIGVIPIGLVIAMPLCLSLASWRSTPRERGAWWGVAALSGATIAFFLLVTTSLFDHTDSAWAVSRISGWFTLSGLLLSGLLSGVVARLLGARI